MLAAILVNDFVLKAMMPSALSGILSDVAGMLLFPCVGVALAEACLVLTPSRAFATPAWFLMASIVTAASFLLVKFTEAGEAAFVAATSAIPEVVHQVVGVNGEGASSDPRDLLALCMLPMPLLIGLRYRATSVDADQHAVTED